MLPIKRNIENLGDKNKSQMDVSRVIFLHFTIDIEVLKILNLQSVGAISSIVK